MSEHAVKRQRHAMPHATHSSVPDVCPFLDTIDRKALDFDHEKLCCVSLSNQNVYACLVCGKYYQGRGRNSHAYFHALEKSHHVFMNLETEKIYCLPDGYEVIHPSLNDIVDNLHPRFSKRQVRWLHSSAQQSVRALDGSEYFPGLVGLNNIKRTDWFNVVIQSLVHIPPLRDFFLVEENYKSSKSAIVRLFGQLVSKLWSSHNFKGHVSPHELIQAISSASGKRFRIGAQSDPHAFLSWFLNALHRDLGGTRKCGSSIIHKVFQGELEITTTLPKIADHAKAKVDAMDAILGRKPRVGTMTMSSADRKVDDDEDDDCDDDDDDGIGLSREETERKKASRRRRRRRRRRRTNIKRVPFLFLSLELPNAPLFKDTYDKNFMKQIPLMELLGRFNGEKSELLTDGSTRKMQLVRLPRYLIVHIRRFQKNNWFTEKNPILVNFPLRNLDIGPFVKAVPSESTPDCAISRESLMASSIKELRRMCANLGVSTADCAEKRNLVDAVLARNRKQRKRRDQLRNQVTTYDLLANVVHAGTPKEGIFKLHLLHEPTDTWYEMQDLHLTTTETMPQQVALSEAFLQLYHAAE